MFGQTFTMMFILKVYETQKDRWFSALMGTHLGKCSPLLRWSGKNWTDLMSTPCCSCLKSRTIYRPQLKTIQSLLGLSGHITQIYMTSSAGSVETSRTPGCHCGQPIPLPLQQLKHISNKITSSAASIGRRLGNPR